MDKAKFIVGIALLAFFAMGCPTTHGPTKNTAKPNSAPLSLTGTEWLLQDLAGTPALPNVKATLVFPESGRVAGNASCNRFTGSADISGDTIKFGMLASTRMACMDNSVSSQETEYLKALAAAKRFELKDSTLLIYAEGYKNRCASRGRQRRSLNAKALTCAQTGCSQYNWFYCMPPV